MANSQWIRKLGRKIRHYRMKRGLTIEQAADRYGCTRRWWSTFEQGRNVSVDVLRRIAKAIGVQAKDLLSR